MRAMGLFMLAMGCSSTPKDSAAAPTGCSAASANNLTECVEPSRYRADLDVIGQPRAPGTAHWQVVQDLCASRFAEYGLEVERHDYGTGVNVIGVKPGQRADRVMLGAHYDSTDNGCVGADDNASGTAGVIEAARVLSTGSYDDTLVFACWDEEERGLIGSSAFAAREQAASVPYKVVYNLEMIGYTDQEPGSQGYPTGFDQLFFDQVNELEERGMKADFIAIIPDEFAREYGALAEAHANRIGLLESLLEVSDALKMTSYLADLRRSDHAAWWAADVPAVFITDTSEFRNPNYHCRSGTTDTLDTMDYAFGASVVQMTVGAIADTATVLP
jgi:hypothetical protein